MPKFRTHYDNLKVSRDAPIEVIQAAYRSLARKYHPDMNASAAKAEAVMKIINASYEVLSDPVKRAAHDDWIAAQLREHEHDSFQPLRRPAPPPPRYDAPQPATRESPRTPGRRPWTPFSIVLAICYVGVAFFMLRTPGLRNFGLGMMIVGWMLLPRRR
ncbi:MAG: J domain-containing protein [Opitutus sp.]